MGISQSDRISRQTGHVGAGRSSHTKERLFSALDSSVTALQRQNAENSKQIFPEKEYRGLSPNFHIHVSVSKIFIPTLGLPFLLEEICGPLLGIYKSLTDT